MKATKREWDEFHSRMMTRVNKDQIESARRYVLEYDTDPQKVIRIDRQECKSCYYHPPRISLQAFTNRECGNCEEVMTFRNSITDELCERCAKLRGVCKHCSGEMD